MRRYSRKVQQFVTVSTWRIPPGKHRVEDAYEARDYVVLCQQATPSKCKQAAEFGLLIQSPKFTDRVYARRVCGLHLGEMIKEQLPTTAELAHEYYRDAAEGKVDKPPQ